MWAALDLAAVSAGEAKWLRLVSRPQLFNAGWDADVDDTPLAIKAAWVALLKEMHEVRDCEGPAAESKQGEQGDGAAMTEVQRLQAALLKSQEERDAAVTRLREHPRDRSGARGRLQLPAKDTRQ